MCKRIFGLALLVSLFTSTYLLACPFCTQQGQTLLGEVNQAHLIVFGTMTNARRDTKEFDKGATDFNIELVIKDHEFLNKQKTLTLPRYVPQDPKRPTKWLVFIEVNKGEIDPYRGISLDPDTKIGEYLKGALAVREKDAPTRLHFFNQYLDSKEPEIAIDAYKEFGNADYKEFRKMAEKLDPESIVKRLKDPETSPVLFGLYGSMLGHCGKTEEHAKVLREILDDPKKRSTGVDGILAGYVMVLKDKGWAYLSDVLKDSKQEFLYRYAALRSVRFFWEYREDVVERKKVIEAILPLIDQGDIADLAIDDLRKWEQWQLTDQIMALHGKSSHDLPIIQRSMIRFALSVPDDKKSAKEYLERMRKEDAERVRDVEELLKLERTPPKEPEPSKDKK